MMSPSQGKIVPRSRTPAVYEQWYWYYIHESVLYKSNFTYCSSNIYHGCLLLLQSAVVSLSYTAVLLRAGPAKVLPERQIGHAPLKITNWDVIFRRVVDHASTNKFNACLFVLFLFDRYDRHNDPKN